MNSPTSLEDRSLLLRTLRGDQQAFSALYLKYNKQVFYFAMRILKSEVLAEEVVHDTMLKVLDLGKGILEINNLEAYLKTCSRNISLNMLKRQEVERRANNIIALHRTEFDCRTEEGIILNDAKRILEKGMLLLPPQQQKAFRFCHVDGLKREEAAQQMGISVQTIAVHVKLAVRFLRNYLGKPSNLIPLLIIYNLL